MLRAASGQLGTASTLPALPDNKNRPRLKAIASSSGLVAANFVPAAIARLVELVTIVSGAGAAPGRSMLTIRVVRSQRIVSTVPNRASDPLTVGT